MQKKLKQERKTKTLTVYAHALYLSCDPEACEAFLKISSMVDRISVKQGPSTMTINYLIAHQRISLKLLIPLSSALGWILRTGPALSMLRIGLHELILRTHSIHAALPHCHITITCSIHGLQPCSGSVKLLTTHAARATLVMKHRHLWWLHLLRMRRGACM